MYFIFKIFLIFIFFGSIFGSLGVRTPLNYKITDICNVTFIDQSFTYDGVEHSLFIQGELPPTFTVEYENNRQVKPGTYEVKAKFITNKKIYDTLTATMKIIKDGKYHDVLFLYEDGTSINKVVKHGECLNDIPKPNYKEGHIGVWQYDFKEPIIEDLEVNIEYIPCIYEMTFNFGTHVEKQNISYGEEIKYPNADIFSYKINGWKYQGQPFNEKYYNYTYGITLDADLTFDRSIQGFDYLSSLGAADFSKIKEDGSISLEGETSVPFGKVYDKKWYVEFEVKYISSIDETIDEYPKIGIMYGNNPCHYDDNVSTSSFYYLDNTANYVWVSGNLCNYSIRNGISLVGNEVDSKFNELNKKSKNNNLIKSNNLDYSIITNCK